MGFIVQTRSTQANRAAPYSMADSLPVQTKLTVSKTSDPAEKEADSVARKVVDEQNEKKSAAAAPVSENKPETKDKEIKTKEDKDKKNISKQEDPKKEVKKKSEQKEEKKAAKKGGSDEKKEKIAKQDDKKREVQKKSGNKEEKKVGKKAEGKEERNKERNKEKKPIDKEKDISARPKSINLRDTQPEQQNEEVADEAKLQALEEKINARRGRGKPLGNQVKTEMEQSFSHDFSEVRINDDKEAAELCASLNAQAFAIGNDIFFNTGKYNPESSQGKELLAHELTHVVQQKEHIQRVGVYRKSVKKAAAKIDDPGVVDEGTKTITFKDLKLAKYKKDDPSNKPPLIRPQNYKRSVPLGKTQDDWKQKVGQKSVNKVKPKLEGIAKRKLVGQQGSVSDLFQSDSANQSSPYLFKTVGTAGINNKNRYVIGTIEQAAKELSSPTWDRKGATKSFQVDHVKELQLDGPDEVVNMMLVKSAANFVSGVMINNQINKKAKDHADTKPDTEIKDWDRSKVLKEYYLKFTGTSIDTKGVFANLTENDFWEQKEIEEGTHFTGLSDSQLDQLFDVVRTSDLGSKDEFFVFPSASGWVPAKFKNKPKVYAEEKKWLAPWTIDSKETEKIGEEEILKGLMIKLESGSVTGRSRIKFEEQPPTPLPLTKLSGAKYAGHIDKNAIRQKGFSLKIMSPVDLADFEVNPTGVVSHGQVLPTVPIIKDIGLQLGLSDGGLEISKSFNSGEIKIPPPFKITDCSLTLFANTETGLGLRGEISFEITKVGKGALKASASTGEGFELGGTFDFDKKLFGGVEAHADVSYKHQGDGEDKWEMNGNIKIPPKKIKGIKNAQINVSYIDKIFRADGTAKFDIPGLDEGSLSVTYGEEKLLIEGEASFKHKLIKSGNVKALVEQVGEETNVSLSGNVKPNIPGVETDLSVSYINGVLIISGTVAYDKGRLAGSVTLGFTNQSVGADGKPTGGVNESLTAFGGGSLTLKITDWLQGTAGVMLKPDGSIEVVGKIGIPGTVDIFPKKEINKPVFKAPTIEIPLFAIPVGSRSIGLVATIGGGADAYASIGPGQLTEAAVEVTYNPSHEEDMKVSGNAKFRVPAEAGLRLYVRAGIGLSIGIARVAGGIELGGALGIEGAAEAGVQVNWSPAQGFKLDAEASIYVQPKFKFDVNAYIEAVLDLWVTEFSKEWKWNLYAFEYGPSLRFGVKFPVHYEENKPFDISLNDVQFETPEINVGDFAKGIGKQLVG